MAEPREFRIVENLAAALRNISIAGGYWFDIADLSVKLNKRHDVESRIAEGDEPAGPELPFIILEIDVDSFDYSEKTMSRVEIPFVITGVAMSDTTSDENMMKTFYRLVADIETAIMADITRGDTAQDTKIEERELVRFEGAKVYAAVRGFMTSRRPTGAPNE